VEVRRPQAEELQRFCRTVGDAPFGARKVHGRQIAD
jgi:hypothetical protein